MAGKKAWNYIDGRGGNRRIDWKYKNWRKKVFERDNYTCQECFNRLDLVAHHKKPWRDYPKLRYVVSNGITLCRKCHSKLEMKISKNNKLNK